MSKAKTQFTGRDVAEFIREFVENEAKRADSFRLVELMRDWSGFEPAMWGPSIIGFGSYHYKYPSGHEGDAPMLGFSPRKAAFSLYVYSPTPENERNLENLGKFKKTVGCIYVKKLSDIHLSSLEAICKESLAYLNQHFQCGCRPLQSE